MLIEMKVVDPAHEELVAKGGDALKDLCQKEVALFDAYLRRFGGEYSAGLARFESFAIAGYLYQKLRGRVDESPQTSDLPTGGQDGEA